MTQNFEICEIFGFWREISKYYTQCNCLNNSPLHQENASNNNGPARIKRRMPWEAPSEPLAVDDPLLLPEREVHAEIVINWFLDQEIPKGGYVRILAESLLWEELLGKTRIKTTEGHTTCMEPRRGWTISSSSLNFIRKRWLDREQELITVIQEETERTEEMEEAGYRSPTWSILRALQEINKAKRLEGEAIMSAPPFFQSSGRGDLKFWEEDDGPTVVVWESSSEPEQEQFCHLHQPCHWKFVESACPCSWMRWTLSLTFSWVLRMFYNGPSLILPRYSVQATLLI